MNKTPFPFVREPTECEKIARSVLKAQEQLAYGYISAIHQYTADAKKHVNMALQHLKETGFDKEDIASIIEPLEEITNDKVESWKGHVGIASRIDTAQEELLEIGSVFLCASTGKR